jgi:hypothetical protein
VRTVIFISFLLMVLLGSPVFTPAEWNTAVAASGNAAEDNFDPEQIIKQFSEKESEFYDAWMRYTYTQTAVIKVLSVDNVPVQEAMMLVSEVVFNDDGSREIHAVERRGRLKSIKETPEDEEIIYNLNPFALTSKELPSYDLKYQGKERIDELDCYVFSVKPKSTKGDKIYFEGKIWVDDVDLQIVRTVGRAVPQTRDNKFPEFETLRQVIDGKYWFPVWTHADEVLRFPGQDVRVEETITYEGYKEFKTKSSIRYGSPPQPDDSEK